MNKFSHRNHQQGTIFILFAFALVVLLGITALVVDVGYRIVQRNRLQNVLDAASLRGVDIIYRDGVAGIYFAPGSTTASNAYSAAQNYLTTDATDINFQSTNIIVNWWDQLTPKGPYTFPAVRIQASVLPLQFFGLLGLNATPIQASATAIVPYPSSIRLRTIPLAVADCAVKDGWDSVTQQPKLIAANQIVANNNYVIETSGSTNFRSIGAANNNVGTLFTATGPGTGTGRVYMAFIVSSSGGVSSISCNGTNVSTAAWTPLCSTSNVPPYNGLTSPDFDDRQYACSAATNNTGTAGAGIAPLIPLPSSYKGMESTLSIGQPVSATNGNNTALYSGINGCYNYCPGGLASSCPSSERIYSCEYSAVPIVQTPGGNGTTLNPGTGIVAPSDNNIIGFSCIQILAVKSTGNPKTVTFTFSRGNCNPGTGSGGGKFNGVLLPPKLAG